MATAIQYDDSLVMIDHIMKVDMDDIVHFEIHSICKKYNSFNVTINIIIDAMLHVELLFDLGYKLCSKRIWVFFILFGIFCDELFELIFDVLYSIFCLLQMIRKNSKQKHYTYNTNDDIEETNSNPILINDLFIIEYHLEYIHNTLDAVCQ